MNEIIKKYAAWIVIIIASLCVIFIYQDVVFSLNDYLFNDSSDALKNYFTFASEINEGPRLNSDSMNYPFGENVLFLDCIPLLSWSLSLVSYVFPGITEYSVGILNFIMLFSIVLSSYFIFLILKELKVTLILAIISSVAIAFLAPQIDRIEGHFALAFSFFIPMIWYFFIRFYRSDKKLKWSIIIGITTLCLYFTHAYLGMIAALFLLSSYFIDFIFGSAKKYFNFKSILFVVVQSILPIIIFWCTANFTDLHVGRTTNPAGYFEYVANYASIFTPQTGGVHNFLATFFKLEYSWEGTAYIGLLTIIVLLIVGLKLLFDLIKNSRVNKVLDGARKKVQEHKICTIAFFTGLIFLYISMGYPFSYKEGKGLELFPIVKNFRGIGRFAWVFFYVTTIVTIVAVDRFYRRKNTHVVLLIVLIVPISYFIEGMPKHVGLANRISSAKNVLNTHGKNELFNSAFKKLDFNQYQAILVVPYYHIGSENFTRTAADESYKLSMTLQYHSNLPLMSNYATRTSISEARDLLQVFSPNYFTKNYTSALKSSKPFLLLKVKSVPLSKNEEAVVNRGKLLLEEEGYSLYEISKDALLGNHSLEEVKKANALKIDLQRKDGYLVSDSSSFFLYNDFDNVHAAHSRSGKGAFQGFLNTYNLIDSIPHELLEVGKSYNVSFWMYNNGPNFGQDILNSIVAFAEYESSNVKSDWQTFTDPKQSLTISGDWSQFELDFTVKSKEGKTSIFILGSKKNRQKFWVDDLLVRELDNDIYKFVNHSTIWKNTLLIKANN